MNKNYFEHGESVVLRNENLTESVKEVVLSTDNIEIRKECHWPSECDLCREVSNYIIIFKNSEYGYNKRLILCENHYKSIMDDFNKVNK